MKDLEENVCSEITKFAVKAKLSWVVVKMPGW